MKLFLLIVSIFLSEILLSQEVINIEKAKAEKDYENILVKKLDTDTNSTSLIIWIKKGVKSHKHKTHSELIYVIEGTGKMIVGEKTFLIQNGDYFRIPQNTFHSLEITSKQPMKVLSIQSPEFLGKDRIFKPDAK